MFAFQQFLVHRSDKTIVPIIQSIPVVLKFSHVEYSLWVRSESFSVVIGDSNVLESNVFWQRFDSNVLWQRFKYPHDLVMYSYVSSDIQNQEPTANSVAVYSRASLKALLPWSALIVYKISLDI